MELTPVPRRTSRLGRVPLVAAGAIVVAVILMQVLPLALGLQRFVVTSDAMGDSVRRGSLILTRDVPGSQLRPGDIITFVPPGAAGSERVTRRVVNVLGNRIHTGGDRTGTDPWTLSADTEPRARMMVQVPYVGYPFVGELGRWIWLLAAVPLAAVLLALLADREHERAVEQARRDREALAVPGPRDDDPWEHPWEQPQQQHEQQAQEQATR